MYSILENMSEIRASQIDYSLKSEHCPMYKYHRLYLNTYTSSTFVQGLSQQWIDFKIPANLVYNLARSRFRYNVPRAHGGLATWSFEDLFSFATDVQFCDEQGVLLCDLKHAGRYTKIARKLETKVDDFIANDATDQLYPCNTLAVSNMVPAQGAGAETGSVNYVEPTYSAVASTVTDFNKFVDYPLDGFKQTILAYDKDLYFDRDMYLKFNVSKLNQQFWTTAGNDADANLALRPSTNPDVAAADPADCTFRNVFLYLAVETNPVIVAAVKQKFEMGQFHINIPYTVAVARSTAAVGANSISHSVSKAQGQKLLQVLHTVWNPNDIRNTAYDCDNYAAKKVVSYRTKWDENYLQDTEMSCAEAVGGSLNSDDWFIANKKYCKDNLIQNKMAYKINWFHLDRFYKENDDISSDNLDVGINLEPRQMTYNIDLNTAIANLVNITYFTFRKGVRLTKDGIIYDTPK